MNIMFCFLLSIAFILLTFLFTDEGILEYNGPPYSDEYIYFEITEPEFLKYTLKAKPARNFGSSFDTFFYHIALVVAEPYQACSSFLNKLELRNNIGLIQRGECSFLSKCIQAENTGILGILIYDNVINDDVSYINMINDDTNRNCSIPVAFIQGKDGYMIRRLLTAHGLNRAFINIPLNLSEMPFYQYRDPPWLLW